MGGGCLPAALIWPIHKTITWPVRTLILRKEIWEREKVKKGVETMWHMRINPIGNDWGNGGMRRVQRK